MNVHHSIVIDRPVDDVFKFVSDASNDHLWETGVEACVPDREPSIGQQRDVRMKVFGRQYQGAAEVTEFEPNQRLTIELLSGLPVTGKTRFEFDGMNGATRLNFSLQAEPASLLFGIVQPVMGWVLQRQWEDDLRTLKGLLENGG